MKIQNLNLRKKPRILFKKLIQEKVATNSQFKMQEKILQKPKPMNTVDLLSTAAEKFGYTVERTKSSAENLYLDGFISYPRTESRAFNPSFEVQK